VGRTAYEELPGPPRRSISGAPPLVPTVAVDLIRPVGSSVAGRHQTERVELNRS
jgi:hypothetical protein